MTWKKSAFIFDEQERVKTMMLFYCVVELLTSQKLQSLLYLLLVAGNFLNSVSSRILILEKHK